MQLSLIDVIGTTGAALTTFCWLPQAAKILRENAIAFFNLVG